MKSVYRFGGMPLDLRLQQISHTLIKVNSSLWDLKILLIVLLVVMFFK